MNPLEAWVDAVVEALGIRDRWTAADRDVVLGLTRDVAHGVSRPAAPLTAYLVGIAVGAGAGTPRDLAERVAGLAPPSTPPQ